MTPTMTNNDIKKTYNALLRYETSAQSPPDGRRVIRDERMRLYLARQGETRLGRGNLIAVAVEAQRILAMWA